MIEVGPNTIDTLAEKLSTLDLTDGERYVLDRLIERAGQFETEVAGFADHYTGLDSGADLSPQGHRIAVAAGII